MVRVYEPGEWRPRQLTCKYLFLIPASADSAAAASGPIDAAVSPTIMPMPEQVSIIGKSVNYTVATGEDLLEVPSDRDFPGIIVLPFETPLAPAIVAIP